MKQNVYKGEWAGCSNFQERREELSKAHEEFLKMQANGFTVTEARVKRPRIQQERTPKQVIVTLGGEWTVKMSFAEYQQRGQGLRIVMKIY